MTTHFIVSNRSWPESNEEIAEGLETFTLYSYEFDPKGKCGNGKVKPLIKIDSNFSEAERDPNLFERFWENPTAPKNILIHIHGFQNDNEIAIELIETLHSHYVNGHTPIEKIVLVAWPSKDPLEQSRSNAEKTGVEFANQFDSIKHELNRAIHPDRPDLGEISKYYVTANSMGNRVIANFVHTAIQNGAHHNSFEQLILLAADLDHDVFSEGNLLADVELVCNRTHVYFDHLDTILAASAVGTGDKIRLGQIGPQAGTSKELYAVDVTLTKPKDSPTCVPPLYHSPLHHFYSIMNKSVVTDIQNVLRGVQANNIPARIQHPLKENFFQLNDLI